MCNKNESWNTLKKNIFLLALIALIFVGCGYKGDPVYSDATKEKSK